MESFARAVIRFRIIILVIVTLITVALGAALPRLTTDDDVMQFLPADDPDIKLFRRVNERFGGLDVAIVGLESEKLFTTEYLNQLRQLTRSIGEVDGVFDVLSFTEVPAPKPSPFGLVVEPLVDKVPSDEAALAALKKRVLANENAVGNLVSEDGRAAMVLCFLGGKRPAIHVAADIKNAASSIWKGEGIYYGGAPFIRLHVAGGTKEDLNRLTPVVAAVVLLVTFLLFRKPLGVLLSLGVVGVSLVWLMGLLALRGEGITVVGSALPTLLVAIGGAYGIHILAAYFSGKSPAVKDRIAEAFREVGAPVIVSTLTTCAGFLSFLAMDVAPLRDFGAAAALGVGMTGLLAMTVIPAVLSFSKKVPRSLGAQRLASPLGRIGGWAARSRAWALTGAVALAIVGLAGVVRVAPDATLKTFFSEGSEPDQANKFLERHFGGSVYLQIYFEGDMRSPFVLAELRKLVEFANGMNEVVQVSSIIDPLVMMSEAMGGRADLPLNRERTQSLYPFLDGSAAINQIVAPEKDASLVQIRLKDIGPEEVNRAVAKLNEFVKAEIPLGVKAIVVDELPKKDRARRMKEIRTAIAKRVVRLARIHSDQRQKISDEGVARVVEAIGNPESNLTVAPGPDLKTAVAKVVEEHLQGEAAPFEEPEPDIGTEIETEWEQRAELAIPVLVKVASEKVDTAKVQAALLESLPLTSARDPEGLDLTAEAITSGLALARATLRAQRLVGPVLSALGVTNPSEILTDRTMWAITDIDVPTFGFPNQTEDGSRVMASVTGQPVVNVAMCESTIRNQLRSLAVALIVLTLILSFTFRSLVSGLKALMPPVIMLAVAVGVMGAAAIPIDLTTSMIAAIALGIGVDYGIHFLWRRRRRGESLAETTAHVGPSIASNALQVAAGFAVMALSDMVPMQRFGLLVGMTMVLSAVATFVLLPALRAEGAVPVTEEDPEEAGTVPTSPR
ncbi:MAG: MMPL family transporter [Deltaproteobacteria bacterium]|nr:MMPL family transporter [Deltaproteobacteria bacterium]